MYSLTSLLLAGSIALQTVFSLPDPSRVKERDAEILKRSVDSFIATESPIALADLLCNIGADGACASGAKSGIVIASPDKVNPNCKKLFHLKAGTLANESKISTHGPVILLLHSNVLSILSSVAILHHYRPRSRTTSALKLISRPFPTLLVGSQVVA